MGGVGEVMGDGVTAGAAASAIAAGAAAGAGGGAAECSAARGGEAPPRGRADAEEAREGGGGGGGGAGAAPGGSPRSSMPAYMNRRVSSFRPEDAEAAAREGAAGRGRGRAISQHAAIFDALGGAGSGVRKKAG